ncbi:hypothetical protein FT638_11525 [Bacillus cereus]|nr:hypothetical protein [Bacillus cereus]
MMVWYDIVLRLLIAIIVGACIGMERQWRHRMAGLRTNAAILIEKIVSRMLLESGVTAAGWKTSLDLEAG